MNAMQTHPMHEQAMETLVARAVDRLRQSTDGLIDWCGRVRAADGAPGRFRWAIKTTREANVAATAYLLGALHRMGITDRVITEADRSEGIAWVTAMDRGDGHYYDPALLDRRTPGWPADKPWPDAAMLGGVDQYARNVLRNYVGGAVPESLPPPGWPQPEDGPAAALEFIRTRPYETHAWGACSHAMRMATWLLHWYQQGRMPLDPCIEALRFFYSIQDPETGLWGGKRSPLFDRINGTFKLFPLIREELNLPLPHADKLIDQVLSEFYRSDYDEKVGACDDWDNWYVIALALDQAPAGYRADEIRKLAAYRIPRTFDLFGKPDGGLSYNPSHCTTSWIGFDMAPAIAQSDVMGPGILCAGINVCIDLLGLHKASSWTGEWRMRKTVDEALRQEIVSRVFGSRSAHGC